MSNRISTNGALMDHKFYRVEDLPEDYHDPSKFKKGIAYRVKFALTQGLFPYRGMIDYEDVDVKEMKVGIYFIQKGNKNHFYIRHPMTRKESETYSLETETDYTVAMVDQKIAPESLTSIAASIGKDGKVFRPQIHSEDDPLNMLIKLGIRLKDAPFEPFGKLLENYTTPGNTSEGTNRRNNVRRALGTNRHMSVMKALLCSEIWGMDIAFVIKDTDGTIFPMREDGKPMVLYPNSEAFDLKDAVDVSNLVQDAISETVIGDYTSSEEDEDV